jgi:tetratricopeptide (TPR) repeat protein
MQATSVDIGGNGIEFQDIASTADPSCRSAADMDSKQTEDSVNSSPCLRHEEREQHFDAAAVDSDAAAAAAEAQMASATTAASLSTGSDAATAKRSGMDDDIPDMENVCRMGGSRSECQRTFSTETSARNMKRAKRMSEAPTEDSLYEAGAISARHLADSLFKANNFEQALAMYSKAIDSNPGDHILYSNRSACFARMACYQEAGKDAASCIRLKPTWAKGYSRLGLAEYYLQNYDEAVHVYQNGLSINPGDVGLAAGLADALKAQAEKRQLAYHTIEFSMYGAEQDFALVRHCSTDLEYA